jgi:hypothetical protein
MTKPGISRPTDLEGFSVVMALQISASEIGVRYKGLENCGRGGMSIKQCLS